MTKQNKKDNGPAYYLTLFKIEGHETWRGHYGRNSDAFDVEWSTGIRPKVTARKLFRIDRISGDIKELK